MHRPVIQFLTVCCSVLVLFSAPPSQAASLYDYDYNFSGYVATAIETAPSGPPKSDAAMLGEPFSALVSIQQSSSGAATGTARLDVNVVGNFYLFPFPNNQTGSGATYSGNTDFRNYNPNFSSGSWPDFTFSYFNGSPSSDVLTAQFNIAGINTADDNGPLSLTLLPTSASVSVVSPVPLPPTLPLFASGLLALGLLAFWRRRPRRLADAIGPTSPLAVIDLIGAV